MSEDEISKLVRAFARALIAIQKEIVEMILKVTSLKVGIGESICRNKISLYELNYVKLTEKAMDIINNFWDPGELLDEVYPEFSIVEKLFILQDFLIGKPVIKEIIDFNFTLLTHLQNILESKRSFADQYIMLRISVLALFVSLLALLITTI